MEPNNFEKLIAKRQRWVQSSKENNFDFDSILAGIYNDPSHFIYEILQNAEDEGAKEITFSLFEDHLKIFHNGKDFDFNDVDGITGIGISTKKDDINAIGKFGVGFKSVFAITKTPIIHSGSYHFQIEDFVIPSVVEGNGIEKTLIMLPFNHPSRTKEEVFEIISNKLEIIGLKTLLFLKNIEEIIWKTPKKNGHYYKDTTGFKNFENVHRVSIISKIEQDEKFEEYLVINKAIQIDSNNLKVEVAYRIDKNNSGNETIVKEKESELIVFFPTEKVTYLNFLIQAPYKTTANRADIPLDDEQNRLIIEETANLVADSIPIIQELGFLNVSFLEVLPIDQNHSDEIIYSSIYGKVKEKLSSEEAFLPTSKNNFTTANNALLARGKELSDFLNNADIYILFKKENWLDTNITRDKTKKLLDYLINELDVKEVEFEDFAVNISKEFIEKKSDDWLVDFYVRLLDHRSLWAKSGYNSRIAGILREKPIIRLSDNTHIVPFDENNKIQVYLPAETRSKYKTVKEILTENENSLKFLTELGLTKPDLFAEIREFVIPKYSNPELDVVIEEYFDDFEKLLIAFQKDMSNKQKELTTDLKKLFIIHSTNSITNSNQFRKANEVYLKNENLSEYFKEYDSVFFVSDELYQRFSNNKDRFLDFLMVIGCENKPRRIQVDPDLTEDEKYNLRKNIYNGGLTYEIHTIDYDYEGLESFLTNLTKVRSCILWKFLLKSIESYDRYSKSYFFKGEYKWKYYNDHTADFDSKFLKTLKSTSWIVDKNDNFVLPNQISLSELPDCYAKDDDNVEMLIDILGFQVDEIKRIEEKTGGKFISKEEYEGFLQWKQEKSKQKETGKVEENDSWNSEIEPEYIKPVVSEIEFETIETPHYGYQQAAKEDNIEHTEDLETEKPEEPRKEISRSKLKDIGRWGERYVFKHLKEKFTDENSIEIRWLNKGRDVGRGYDFSIMSNGVEIEYIEVKSKIDEQPQLFEITGTQWEFARKLYNENEGDKYKIYIVNNAGSKKAKIGIIKNPTKLWKEGKLYAHPVHFKL